MNILIINASKSFGHSSGKLNDYLTEIAKQTLTGLKHNVMTTRLDDGYDIPKEREKFLSADAVIYQMPAWWMGGPWLVPKYFTDVFDAGTFYTSDGRTRSDPSKKYGSGGLLNNKKYMFSMTWNAPMEAFTDPNQFFEGKGIDGILFPYHKANQFIGMSPLPTFICNDVHKDPQIADDVVRYKKHLTGLFGK